MARHILILFLLVLTFCWFGTLYESSPRNSRIRIVVSDDTLFLGLSFLLGSCGITLAILLNPGRTRLASDYLAFARVLEEEGPLSGEELEEIVGSKEEEDYTNGEQSKRRYFSAGQRRSLEQLAYEGKLRVQGERYSLPGAQSSVV